MFESQNWINYEINTSEFYIETSYLDIAGTASRLTATSSQALNATGSWIAFETVYTPNEVGWAYHTVYLKANNGGAGEGIYIDIKPITTQN